METCMLLARIACISSSVRYGACDKMMGTPKLSRPCSRSDEGELAEVRSLAICLTIRPSVISIPEDLKLAVENMELRYSPVHGCDDGWLVDVTKLYLRILNIPGQGPPRWCNVIASILSALFGRFSRLPCIYTLHDNLLDSLLHVIECRTGNTPQAIVRESQFNGFLCHSSRSKFLCNTLKCFPLFSL